MNKSTFTSRAKKAGFLTSQKAFYDTLECIEHGCYRVYPITAYSRSYSDKTRDYERLLEALGLDYTEGNDAPRGGKTGNFLQLTPSAIRKVKPITKEYMKAQEAERKERQKAQAQEALNKRLALAKEPLSEKEKMEAIAYIKENPMRSALANAPKSVDKLKYASGLSWGQLFRSLTGTNGK